MIDVPRRTPLYDTHVALGGRMVEFGGWTLPVQYGGILSEHNAVRTCAGLFDVSHMGEISVKGPGAAEALQYLLCNDISKVANGRCQYSAIINEGGGVVDDLIVYRFSETDFLLCVNAGNTEKDFAWLKRQNRFSAEIENLSATFGQIAIQGPMAAEIFKRVCPETAGVKHFSFCEGKAGNDRVVCGRTGYTGEDGFEIFIEWERTANLWNAVLEAGKAEGLMPCGLGARDTLRLEAALPLHGHEINDDVSALESGLGWIVSFEKGDFLGRQALVTEKERGTKRKVICFQVDEPGIARGGDQVFSGSGELVGQVTSGTKSPTLGVSIGTALIKSDVPGGELSVEVRGRKLKIHEVGRPFYKRKKSGG